MKLSWRRGGDRPIDPNTDEHGNPVHRHTFAPVAAQAAVRQPLQPARTIVLLRCASCGEIDSQALEGTWTLEQITGGTQDG